MLTQSRTLWILGPSGLLCLILILLGSLPFHVGTLPSLICLAFKAYFKLSLGEQGAIRSAVRRAEKLESWLSDDNLINFIDLLHKDVDSAAVYSAIEGDGIRIKWVRRQLGMEEA